MKKRLGLDYDQLFHEIPGNYIVMLADDPHFTVVEVSDSLCKIIGQPREKILEKALRDVLPLSDDKESNEGTNALLESFRQTLKTRVMHDAGVIRYDIRDGDEFVRKLWLTKNYPIITDGKPVGVIMDAEDVTTLLNPDAYAKERIAHLEHLLEINQSKDEFISIASHQLRTPATGVKQYLGMVLEGFFGDVPESQRGVLERAYQSNERQLRIVTDLLKVAQVDAGKVALRPTVFDVNDFVSKIVDDNAGAVKRRAQLLTYSPAAVPAEVYADSETLRMVIENILDNASKYSESKKRITVSIINRKKTVTIRIKDRGVGVSLGKVDKMFEKFSRVDNILSAKVDGTGLGLYWAKKIIDLHGGSIGYRPNKPNGSIFDVTLPKQNVV